MPAGKLQHFKKILVKKFIQLKKGVSKESSPNFASNIKQI